jgi:hypothetical protein
MMRGSLHVENLGHNAFLITKVEKFTGSVPADINADLHPLRSAEFTNQNTRTHAGELPTQGFPGLHTAPSIVLSDCGSGAVQEPSLKSLVETLMRRAELAMCC